MTDIEKIFTFFGGRKPLAEKLDCKPQALTRWKSEGIPAYAAIKIEELSGGKFKATELPLWRDRQKTKAA